jgi:hypothetical protein
MDELANICDDYYLNLNLATELELPSSRETILCYFEQLQKKFPTMHRFYSRDKRDFVLEEDKSSGSYRWSTVETKRICSGYVNPPTAEAALDQHRFVLDTIPYTLSISPLECEALDMLYGFDFNYRGNHNVLVSEALGICQGYEKLLDIPGSRLLNYEPIITLTLDEECRTQVRLSIETRNSLAQIRSGEYGEEQISVFFTLRSYGSLRPGMTFIDTFNRLATQAQEIVHEQIIPNVLQPLARTIALK